jgi:hypothetical protein
MKPMFSIVMSTPSSSRQTATAGSTPSPVPLTTIVPRS